MNWRKVKKDCPKAFEVFLNWLEYYDNTDKNKAKPIFYLEMRFILGSERELYDFFDEQEIIVMIWHRASGVVCVEADTWNFKIDKKNGRILKDGRTGPQYKVRPKAERAAFIKAFELLEQKLC